MTVPADLTPQEPHRLEALRRLNVVDTPIEERFERITRLARQLLGVRIAAISLVEADRQWFKSICGLDVCQTSRDVSFCAHGLESDETLVVPDARLDPRFLANPLVTGEPRIVFYAGAPIHAPDGSRVGMLCVIDDKPRSPDHVDHSTLHDLAAMAERELTLAPAAPAAEQARSVDVAERRSLVDDVTRLWNHDGITRVARTTFNDARAQGRGCTIVRLNLTGLDTVCQNLGRNAGEQTLRNAGRCLLGAFRETDIIGRLDNSGFLAVLCPTDGRASAAAMASRAVELLNASIASGSHTISARFGIWHCEPDSDTSFDEAATLAERNISPGAAERSAA